MGKKKKDKNPKKENRFKGKKSAGKTKKKKTKLQVSKVKVSIKSSYNNTIISISDFNGNVLVWSSPGIVGFTGSRKSTAYAATKAAVDAVERSRKFGAKEAVVIVKGTGMGRQAAVKGLRTAGLKIITLSDHTSIPHGGVSPRKRPRGS